MRFLGNFLSFKATLSTLHGRTRRINSQCSQTLVKAFHDTLAIVENVISLYRPCSSRFYYVYRCYFRGKTSAIFVMERNPVDYRSSSRGWESIVNRGRLNDDRSEENEGKVVDKRSFGRLGRRVFFRFFLFLFFDPSVLGIELQESLGPKKSFDLSN